MFEYMLRDENLPSIAKAELQVAYTVPEDCHSR
jgi:hypothetical protein